MTDITPVDLYRQLSGKTPPRLIDVREPDEFASGHIAGSVNIPLGTLDRFSQGLTGRGETYCLYCRSGGRSGAGKALLASRGIVATDLRGGLLAWEAAGLPVERQF